MGRQSASMSGLTVEWDDTKHPGLRAREAAFDKARIPRSAANDDEFVPSRILLNLKLDLGDDKTSTVQLDHVHLKIPYQGKQPTVGWWTGARWVTFKQVTYAGNVADVTLPSPWPTDPPIGAYP